MTVSDYLSIGLMFCNVVIAFVGWLAKNAFEDLTKKVDTTSNKVENLVASQAASARDVAVLTVRMDGQIEALIHRINRIERDLDGNASGEWPAYQKRERSGGDKGGG